MNNNFVDCNVYADLTMPVNRDINNPNIFNIESKALIRKQIYCKERCNINNNNNNTKNSNINNNSFISCMNTCFIQYDTVEKINKSFINKEIINKKLIY